MQEPIPFPDSEVLTIFKANPKLVIYNADDYMQAGKTVKKPKGMGKWDVFWPGWTARMQQRGPDKPPRPC